MRSGPNSRPNIRLVVGCDTLQHVVRTANDTVDELLVRNAQRHGATGYRSSERVCKQGVVGSSPIVSARESTRRAELVSA